jgi:hypothetical protein
MKLVRSWPANIPEGRSYVVDDIERFVMGADNDTQFDYRRLVDYDDDVVLIEWDIAVGGEQLRTFIDRARAEPDRVRVAPYLLYRGGLKGDRPQVPFYVHRVREPGMRTWVKGRQTVLPPVRVRADLLTEGSDRRIHGSVVGVIEVR